MPETLKSTCEEVHFLAKLMLEAYNFTQNELLCRHFADTFTLIQSVCLSCLEFQEHILCSARLSGYF